MSSSRSLLKKIIAVMGALTALSGCSRVSILNAIIPHEGYSITRDIAYGDDSRQKLDIYIPDDVQKPAKVIVFFYGGSWESGDKKDYRFVGQAFASKGYITVVADYRLYPNVYFPTFMTDCAKAFVWAHAHIGEYGGDANNLYLAGHSAGAFNAMMLTVNDTYLKQAGGNRSWIKGMVGLAGPYDFLPMEDPQVIAVFSKVKDSETQPINYVTRGLPPMLLLTGDKDKDVLPRNSKHMAQKLEAYGDAVTLHIYPGVAHIGIILALADGFRGKAPVLDDIDAFIRENQR